VTNEKINSMDIGSDDDNIEGDDHCSTKTWVQQMRSADVYEADVQMMIFNFLVVMGMEEAAEAFVEETKMSTQMSFDPSAALASVSTRNKVKDAILKGDINQALEMINKENVFDDDFLENHPMGIVVNFRLKQKILEKTIEGGGIDESVEYARINVAPLVSKDQSFLGELEKSMGWLVFENITAPEAIAYKEKLLSYEAVAELVDDAILRRHGIPPGSKLEVLCQNLSWCQKQLSSDVVPHLCIPRLDKGVFDPKVD